MSDTSVRSCQWGGPSGGALHSNHSLDLSSNSTRAGHQGMSMAAAAGAAIKVAPCYAVTESCISPRAAQLMARHEFDCIYESSLQQVEILAGVPIKTSSAAVVPAACSAQPGSQLQTHDAQQHQAREQQQYPLVPQGGAQQAQAVRRHSSPDYHSDEHHAEGHRQLMTTAGPAALCDPPAASYPAVAAGRDNTCCDRHTSSPTPHPQPHQSVFSPSTAEPAVLHSSPQPYLLDVAHRAASPPQDSQQHAEAPAHASEQGQHEDVGAELLPGDPPAFLSTSASIANVCANCGSRQTPGCWRRGWHIRGYVWANLCNRWAAVPAC
jgi:hypothetical protein